MPVNEYLGVFSEPPSLHIGDTYGKPTTTHSRFGGKQLGVPFPTEGRLQQAFIDKEFKLYSEGEPFKDPHIIDREIRRKAGEHPPEGKAFFPAAGAKQNRTKGHPDLAIGAVPFDTTSINYSNRPPAKRVPVPRNLYLNRPQVGGPGFPLGARTIGPPEPYVADTYEAGRELERAMRKKDKIEKPFNGGGCGSTFNHPSTMITQTTMAFKSAQRADKAEAEAGRPKWKPCNPPKQGRVWNEVLVSKIGLDYVADPAPPPVFRSKESTSSAQPAFKPLSNTMQRLSMRTINPYSVDARASSNVDFTMV